MILVLGSISLSISVGLPVLYLFVSAVPFDRGFFCEDTSIRYPYKPDTISTPLLLIMCFGASFIIVSTSDVIKISLTTFYEPQRQTTYLLTCAPNENSDQPAHPRSLIRVFAVHRKKLWIIGYPLCALWRFLSDCANAQADLNLPWAHMSEGTFSDVAARIYIIHITSNISLSLVISSSSWGLMRLS